MEIERYILYTAYIYITRNIIIIFYVYRIWDKSYSWLNKPTDAINVVLLRVVNDVATIFQILVALYILRVESENTIPLGCTNQENKGWKIVKFRR